MLKQLRIRNFALIEQSEVDFSSGLTVITGETGAGKSILLGALHLALGERADVSSLHDKTKKCVVEALFEIKAYGLETFFTQNELDYETTCTLRREITPEGKSRAFINDTPVTLTVMKSLGENLLDIHSQHQTLLLRETSFQFGLVDAFASTNALFSEYKTTFRQYNKARKELDDLVMQEQQARKELDYLQFQFSELSEAGIREGDLKQLEEESETLENAEFIKSGLSKSAAVIHGGDENVLSALALARQQLQQLSKFSKHFTELHERLNSAYIELKELATDMDSAEEDVVYDPARLEEVNTRLDGLNRLLKKHGVASEQELLQVKEDLEQKLDGFSSLEKDIEKLQKNITALDKQCKSLATDLSAKRRKAVPAIEESIREMLLNLAMPNAQFKIELQQADTFGPNGLDSIRFLFTANKGAEFKELHKVASGGELSRLMLCLKAQLAKRTALPTIIFDEIDSGVSGDVADKIGTILTGMGQTMQVITITHLPQIAGKGSNHLFVYKADSKEKTISNIRALTKQERIEEIAKMLSTGKPTEAALKNAKELLNA
ncbi:MAG: DNA repair protein RecN [Bacteroidetes bacterium]|nr:DNA repair protein RecN [Bacteroidota bacterium]